MEIVKKKQKYFHNIKTLKNLQLSVTRLSENYNKNKRPIGYFNKLHNILENSEHNNKF